jgi:hypothetical protein
MKVFYKEMEQSLVNKNGKIVKVSRIKQHNGKKGVEIINKDGKETRKTFKVKNNCRPKIVPILRRLSQRNRIMKKKIPRKRVKKTKRRKKANVSNYIANNKRSNSKRSNSRANNLAGKMTRKKRRKKRKKSKGFFHNFLGV